VTQMDKTQFWQLIEASRNKKRDCDKQTAKLEKLLGKLSPEEIVEFDNIFSSLLIESYLWDLWAVAYIVGGGCSDDGFEYFRRWLIAQGQDYFENALRNPERAADVLNDDDCFCEEIGYVANHVYEQKTGKPLHEALQFKRHDYPDKPSGEPWSEEDLETLYPALWEKFG
jgi:hypothetical protein